MFHTQDKVEIFTAIFIVFYYQIFNYYCFPTKTHPTAPCRFYQLILHCNISGNYVELKKDFLFHARSYM